jgi:trk system potassium uptake protein
MKRTIAVIGLGTFGMQAIKVLAQKGGISTIAIDKSQSVIDSAQAYATESMVLDSTSEEALKASGIKDVDSVIVAIGENSEVSIMTVALLSKMKIHEIVARATSKLHKQILLRVGATSVVMPEEDMATRVANSIVNKEVKVTLDLGENYTLDEIEICKSHEFVGKTIKEVAFRSVYNVNLVMIRKRISPTESINQFPASEYRFEGGEMVLVVGEHANVELFEKKCACD